MDRLPPTDIAGLTLATEELIELCRILDLAAPAEIAAGAPHGDAGQEVARRTLVARRVAVAHRHGVVVHPAVAAVIEAVAAPGVVVRVEVDRRGEHTADSVSISGNHDLLVEHRSVAHVGVHHLAVVDDGDLIARISLAAQLEPGPVADVPGFAVRPGALVAALRELESGDAATALDTLVGGGAPIRPARAFAAAAAARRHTAMVATLWRDHDRVSRSTTSWINGGPLGMWRIPGDRGAAGSALVEPVSAARITAEIAVALPGAFRGRARDGYRRSDVAARAGRATAARS